MEFKYIEKIEELPIGIDVKQLIKLNYLSEDIVEIKYKEDTIIVKVLLTSEYTIVCYGNNLLLELYREPDFTITEDGYYEHKGYIYTLYRIIAKASIPSADYDIEFLTK